MPVHPEIDPFDEGRLDVGDDHRLYWEQCGRVRLVRVGGRPADEGHGLAR